MNDVNEFDKREKEFQIAPRGNSKGRRTAKVSTCHVFSTHAASSKNNSFLKETPTIGMIFSQNCLLFPLAIFLFHHVQLMTATSCETDEYANCNSKDLSMKEGAFKFQWPEWCEVFHGDLNLRVIDLDNADFSKLRKINGSINLINSQTRTMPYMPKLKVIQSDGIRPGVVILNNKELRDMRGFVNWDKEVKVIGHPDFPIFISGNTELDTINLPKAFHKPLSPSLCEKRLTPGYNIQFAESLSLATTLITLILSATIFLYPMSLGSGIVYFVPGYHKETVN